MDRARVCFLIPPGLGGKAVDQFTAFQESCTSLLESGMVEGMVATMQQQTALIRAGEEKAEALAAVPGQGKNADASLQVCEGQGRQGNVQCVRVRGFACFDSSAHTTVPRLLVRHIPSGGRLCA